MTRIIGVVSGKGGVGKTTLVSNLGVALAHEGLNVALLDSNITGPNLGLHFGMMACPHGVQNVMKDEIPLTKAMYKHPSGVDIIPARLSIDYLDVDPVNLKELLNELLYKDYILIDAATGLDRETLVAIDMCDEAI